MGWSAARKLRKVIENLSRILAIELVTSARAIELRTGLQPAKATGKVIQELRKTVKGVGPDRFISPELEAADLLVRSGKISQVAKQEFKELR
jgi:histidine ammonia-lyase